MWRVGFHFNRFSRLAEVSAGFSLFGTIVGIAGTFIGLGPLFWSDLANLPIGLLSVALVIWIFFREFYLARKQKYANITSHYASISLQVSRLATDMADDIAGLHSIEKHERKVSDKRFSEDIGRILDNFAVMFDLLTGTKCRTSIKTIAHFPANGKTEAYALTFARDQNSSPGNRSSDIKRSIERIDVIASNTDFQALLFHNGPTQDYYLNNDIHKSISKGSFRSTSIDWYRRNKFEQGEDGNPRHQVLPYRSTMVWPIRTFETTSAVEDESKFIGFLCVDSEYRSVFNERFDKSLGLAVAGQLVSLFYLKQQLDLLNNPARTGEVNDTLPEASKHVRRPRTSGA